MLWVHDGFNTPAIPLLISLAEYGYANNEITILEGIFNPAWYKPLFEQVAMIFHKENIYAYYYDLPFDETLKRHETKTNRFDFGEEDMKRWWKEKDYIGFIKEETLVKESFSSHSKKAVVETIEQ